MNIYPDTFIWTFCTKSITSCLFLPNCISFPAIYQQKIVGQDQYFLTMLQRGPISLAARGQSCSLFESFLYNLPSFPLRNVVICNQRYSHFLDNVRHKIDVQGEQFFWSNDQIMQRDYKIDRTHDIESRNSDHAFSVGDSCELVAISCVNHCDLGPS